MSKLLKYQMESYEFCTKDWMESILRRYAAENVCLKCPERINSAFVGIKLECMEADNHICMAKYVLQKLAAYEKDCIYITDSTGIDIQLTAGSNNDWPWHIFIQENKFLLATFPQTLDEIVPEREWDIIPAEECLEILRGKFDFFCS